MRYETRIYDRENGNHVFNWGEYYQENLDAAIFNTKLATLDFYKFNVKLIDTKTMKEVMI